MYLFNVFHNFNVFYYCKLSCNLTFGSPCDNVNKIYQYTNKHAFSLIFHIQHLWPVFAPFEEVKVPLSNFLVRAICKKDSCLSTVVSTMGDCISIKANFEMLKSFLN